MWTKIQYRLINLDSVKEVYCIGSHTLVVNYVGVNEKIDGHSRFPFETQEERDQEFDRLERLLLNERGW